MASNTYWEPVKDPTNFTEKSFILLQLKRDVSPTEAYQSFSKQLSFLDCNAIRDVALALTLIDKYGKERFDRIIKQQKQPIQLGRFEHNPIRILFTKEAPILQQRSLSDPTPKLPLSHPYFIRNAPDYIKKHLHGDAQALNLVYVGNNEKQEPLFTGFGLNPKGLTLQEIAIHLLGEYNAPPLQASDLLGKTLEEAFEKTRTVQVLVNGNHQFIPRLALEKAATKNDLQAKTLLATLRKIEAELHQKRLSPEEFFANPNLFATDSPAADIDAESIQKLFS